MFPLKVNFALIYIFQLVITRVGDVGVCVCFPLASSPPLIETVAQRSDVISRLTVEHVYGARSRGGDART